MFCQKCGNEISNKEISCNNCGEKIPKRYLDVKQPKKEKNIVMKILIMIFPPKNRVNRLEFIYGFLFWGAVWIINIMIIDSMNQDSFLAIIASLMMIIALVGFFMFASKRFHDFGRSGWNVLWIIVPIAVFIALLYLFFQKGDEGINKYG